MSNWWDDITRRLAEIRNASGVSPGDFQVNKTIDGEEVAGLFRQTSRLLINEDGLPVFAYIRDHTVGIFNLWDPRNLKKLHFSVCQTLIDMSEDNKFDCYQITNSDSGEYVIELSNGEERMVKLLPCQNCLDELHYKGFSYSQMRWWAKQRIVNGFSAKEAMEYITDHFRDCTKGLRRDFQRAGYLRNWAPISYSYRKSRGFICEKNRALPLESGAGCGVNLRDYPHLTDCHHINGVKSQCDDGNLCCLCKECHAKLHPHYKAPESALATIRRLRAEQGITI